MLRLKNTLLLLLFAPFLARAGSEENILFLQKIAKDKLPPVVEIAVEHDPVYKKARRFRGYALQDLLKMIPGFADFAVDDTLLVFTAVDGYAPAIPLDNALKRKGVVAFQDLSAVKGAWDPLKHGKHTMTPAPFYMVWEDPPRPDSDYPWTYQMASLSLVPAREHYAAAYPKNSQVQPGFKLFAKHCMQCHSINLVGGLLGPELNVPKNITEYWEAKDIRAFIINSKDYRARSKMPSHSHLNASEIDALLAYLSAMKMEKICGESRPCE